MNVFGFPETIKEHLGPPIGVSCFCPGFGSNGSLRGSNGRVSWQTSSWLFGRAPSDAMKGCKAWAKRAHALYEKYNNNPS
jgi:hypothetical protein